MTADRILAWTPRAIVFDCDGTLMDTEQHWEEARALVLRGYGVTPAPEFAARTKGVHYTECGRLMAQVVGCPRLAGEMTRQLLDAFRKLVADDPVTTPGAAELVRRASRFATLAVASNCPRDVVETCLHTAGLLGHFDHVVVPGDGMLPKPAPDVYRSATRRCGAAPEDSLAVEDSSCGILSAARAGLRVLGLGDGGPRADLWVSTLADPDLLDWAGSRVPVGGARRSGTPGVVPAPLRVRAHGRERARPAGVPTGGRRVTSHSTSAPCGTSDEAGRSNEPFLHRSSAAVPAPGTGVAGVPGWAGAQVAPPAPAGSGCGWSALTDLDPT